MTDNTIKLLWVVLLVLVFSGLIVLGLWAAGIFRKSGKKDKPKKEEGEEKEEEGKGGKRSMLNWTK